MDILNEERPEWWGYITTREKGVDLGYEKLPFLDDYGLSYGLVVEYWDKIRLIQEKWWKRLDEKKLIVRIAVSLTVVLPVIGYLTETIWIGVVLFVVHCVVEYLFRKYMILCFRKDLKIVEQPIIEEYIAALKKWNKNKQ